MLLKNYSAQEQGRRNAQEENEKRLRELHDEMDRARQQALRDAQESARVEHEEQRQLLARQNREREDTERKQKEEEGLLQLRLKLLNYDFHKCPRIKKESFQDLEVDDIDLIRIALIGPTGSGKTSLLGKRGCSVYFYLSFYVFVRYSSTHRLIAKQFAYSMVLEAFMFFFTIEG